MDFKGFDSSVILIFRGGLFLPIGKYLEISSQRILVGIILGGRLGVDADLLRRRWLLMLLLLLLLIIMIMMIMMIIPILLMFERAGDAHLLAGDGRPRAALDTLE